MPIAYDPPQLACDGCRAVASAQLREHERQPAKPWVPPWCVAHAADPKPYGWRCRCGEPNAFADARCVYCGRAQ